METIHIKATNNTPEIVLDPSRRLIKITGISYSADPQETYAPVMTWIDAMEPVIDEENGLRCELNLDFINSSAHKVMYEMLYRLQDLYNDGKKIVINWYYDPIDEDLLEMGEDFLDVLHIPIKLVERSTPQEN